MTGVRSVPSMALRQIVLWGGGRAGFGSDNPEEVLELNDRNMEFQHRLTFSNSLLKKRTFIR